MRDEVYKETIILKDVFSISEYNDGKKERWTRIGVGFVNKDRSINVILDAIPVNGRFHIRDRVKTEKNPEKESSSSYGINRK